MKEWLKKWRNPLFIASMVFLLFFGLTIAFLTDAESRANIVTIGQVKIKLTEEGYVDEQTVVPGQIVKKPPVVSNTGKNDAYVFLEISIPKDNVQILYEEDVKDENGVITHKAGTLKDSSPQIQEIFRTIAEVNTENKWITANVPDIPDFQYHSPNHTDLPEGWEFLGFGEDNDISKSYWFGYNRKLNAKSNDNEDKTIPLFDSVQLKSFIDEDITDDKSRNIGVNAYAIQSDNLELFPDTGYITAENLKEVLEILIRKKNLGEISL